MSAQSTEIAAATLEHSERIRLLTDRVDKQRRSIVQLSYIVAVLLIIQVVGLLPIATGTTSTSISPALAAALIIALASAALGGLVIRRRGHAV
jgi:hypothetical protein